jgi:hypothetical protein
MASWIQIDGKLIPKEKYHGDNARNQSAMVIPPLEPFVSPVTGEIITSHRQLKNHNKNNGVTNSSDYSPAYLKGVREDRVARQEKAGHADRIDILKAQLHRS